MEKVEYECPNCIERMVRVMANIIVCQSCDLIFAERDDEDKLSTEYSV